MEMDIAHRESDSEQGYMLLAVVFLTLLVLISLAVAAPKIAMSAIQAGDQAVLPEIRALPDLDRSARRDQSDSLPAETLRRSADRQR
jgi:hypothetical protein